MDGALRTLKNVIRTLKNVKFVSVKTFNHLDIQIKKNKSATTFVSSITIVFVAGFICRLQVNLY